MSWEKKQLEDVADFMLGKMLDQKKNKGEPLPYLANVNVRWGSFDLDNLRQMKFEPHEAERFGLKYGDIVICEGGEPGRCAIWKDYQPRMMIQKALHRIRPHDGLDNRFLFYTFFHKGKTGGFSPLFTGSTIKHLPREKLAKVEVEIPPVPTQQRIASILSAYDDLIENNRRRIQLLEQAARLLYKEWFVHLRFPGHEHTKIHNGIPEGWERKRLSEVASMNVESYKARDLPDEINYIDISSVTQGRISSKAIFSSDEPPGRARRKARSGDVIWSNVRPNLRAYALVIEPEDNDVFSTGFTVLTPTAIPFSYLYLLVTTDEFVSYLVNHATGASYPAVRPDDFERANVLLPSWQILELFHEKAETIFKLISTLEKENRSLTKARDLLLPRLMSGEVTV
jgi:type I restriction enzyme S subunit